MHGIFSGNKELVIHAISIHVLQWNLLLVKCFICPNIVQSFPTKVLIVVLLDFMSFWIETIQYKWTPLQLCLMWLIWHRLVPLRLEMEELLVSCLLCFLANAIGSFFGSKSGKLGKVWSWSSLQGTYLGGAEQCAATPETFEVVQVSRACSSVRFSKVVKQWEELDCWAAPAATRVSG
jgi:hypothetical protein